MSDDSGGHAREGQIATEELSPVARSLIWAFANGICWTPALHSAFNAKQSLSAFFGDTAVWQHSGSPKLGHAPHTVQRRVQRRQGALRAHTISRTQTEQERTSIDGEELYKVLTLAAHENVGGEHNGIKFDTRGIKARGLHVRDENRDGVALNAFGLRQPIPVALEDCLFEGDIVLDNGQFGHFSLAGATLVSGIGRKIGAGFSAISASFDGDLILTKVEAGFVNVARGRIGSNFDLTGSRIGGPNLYNQVSMSLKPLGGSEVRALNCNAFTVGASALCLQAVVEGQAEFIGARFGLSIEFGESCFINPKGFALDLYSVTAGAGIFLTKLKRAERFGLGPAVDGILDLRRAKTSLFLDDGSAWPSRNRLFLTGFIYEAVGDGTFDPAFGASRALRWLSLQHRASRWVFIETQPWTQLAGTLRAVGRSRDARSVLMNMNMRQTASSILALDPIVSQPLVAFIRAADSWVRRLPSLLARLYKRPQSLLEEGGRIGKQFVTNAIQGILNPLFLLPTYVLKLLLQSVFGFTSGEAWAWALATALIVWTILTFFSGFVSWVSRIVSALVRLVMMPIFGILVGWGFMPLLTVLWSVLTILLGSLVFQIADESGHMRPTEEEAVLRPEYVATCSLHSEYEPFNAMVYSLDAFLPFVDLHQEQYWRPQDSHHVCVPAVDSLPANATREISLEKRYPKLSQTYARLVGPRLSNYLPKQVAEAAIVPDSWVEWLDKQFNDGGLRSYLWIHIALGYILATLALTAFTGLIRKED